MKEEKCKKILRLKVLLGLLVISNITKTTKHENKLFIFSMASTALLSTKDEIGQI